ncbi:MAG: YebC/PmpR family DNA-binding regulatory protein [Hyphomicrobiaceae bacterium]|jgi:YebC/PmpR family DNA-binding regulatory protein
MLSLKKEAKYAMSGHSKWSSIKHKKAATDAKRGKIFTKLIREITVAARSGGADLSGNPRLRTAVASAKAAQMPAVNIERGIKKGIGASDGAEFVEGMYEGYGPDGVAVILEVLTDNRNRTVADVRHTFSKNGGNLGETNCVQWMFDRVGQIFVEGEGATEEQLFEVAIEAGADDVSAEAEGFVVTTTVEALEHARQTLEEADYTLRSAEISFVPQNTVALEGAGAERALRLIDALEDLDDVQRVSANFEIDEEEYAKLSS